MPDTNRRKNYQRKRKAGKQALTEAQKQMADQDTQPMKVVKPKKNGIAALIKFRAAHPQWWGVITTVLVILSLTSMFLASHLGINALVVGGVVTSTFVCALWRFTNQRGSGAMVILHQLTVYRLKISSKLLRFLHGLAITGYFLMLPLAGWNLWNGAYAHAAMFFLLSLTPALLWLSTKLCLWTIQPRRGLKYRKVKGIFSGIALVAFITSLSWILIWPTAPVSSTGANLNQPYQPTAADVQATVTAQGPQEGMPNWVHQLPGGWSQVLGAIQDDYNSSPLQKCANQKAAKSGRAGIVMADSFGYGNGETADTALDNQWVRDQLTKAGYDPNMVRKGAKDYWNYRDADSRPNANNQDNPENSCPA